MKKSRRSILGFLILLFGYLIYFWLRQDPLRVERLYSRGLYPLLMQPYSRLIGLLPFSLAELLALLFFTGIIALIFYALYSILRRGLPKPALLLSLLKKGVLWVASLYLIFQFSWGLNYQRVPFSQQTGLEVYPSSVEELTLLCTSLIQQAVALRDQVSEDKNGVFVLTYDSSALYSTAQKGYEQAARAFPNLSGVYGTPKGVLLSHYWSYTGTSGMYFPLTGEANVNTTTPPYLIPAITSHEMAHQHGFAREDEANFIGYLTSVSHPSREFQYSGTMLALNNAMSQLYRADPEGWATLRERYSDGMLRDLADHRAYYDRYQGKVWETSNKVNNQYLILNRQKDGVQSYGRMVDLLLAYKRAHPNLFSCREINPSFFQPSEMVSQTPSS